MIRRAASIIGLLALAHAALYIVYQQGEWSGRSWTDQIGYQRLGASLATTGSFTRYADSGEFVPEVIRTPGYPAFVAVIYTLFGVGNNMAVAVAQASAFAAICWMVFGIARRVADERAAIAAAAMTALYSPLPYFGSLIVTELWTTFMATAAILSCLRAVRHGRARDYALTGALMTATTLVRPVFVLLPFFLAAAVPLLVRQQRNAAAVKGWAVLAATAAVTLLPWLAYNYVNLGQVTLSPAGGVGRGLWESTWQGRWRGALQAELTLLAESTADRGELTRLVEDKARQAKLPAAPMLQYVNEWRDIHDFWNTPTDPEERIRARIAADRDYLRRGVANIRQNPLGHVRRRLTRGLFILWAAEIPVRYGDINALPGLVIRGMWLVQVILLGLAAIGVALLARHGRWSDAVVLTLPLIYVTAVHVPLLCEARQSLPVKPVVLVLAGIAVAHRRSVISRQIAAS
jgi:4-amino-4-deoxy-L-arabinose transferase-like glycosyltransferase